MCGRAVPVRPLPSSEPDIPERARHDRDTGVAPRRGYAQLTPESDSLLRVKICRRAISGGVNGALVVVCIQTVLLYIF